MKLRLPGSLGLEAGFGRCVSCFIGLMVSMEFAANLVCFVGFV